MQLHGSRVQVVLFFIVLGYYIGTIFYSKTYMAVLSVERVRCVERDTLQLPWESYVARSRSSKHRQKINRDVCCQRKTPQT
jgi:hypothetical protein